jgi:pimeloyl-ACP methyl ester carboxylesterase
VHEYVDEDLPAAVEEVRRVAGDRPIYLIGHSLGGLVSYAAAPGLTGAIAGIASIGSPYHFTKGSFSLSAVAAFVRLVSAANVRPNPALFFKPVGLGMAIMRRFAESPLYPIPWRGWHKGGVEPDILDEHLRLAFDRAGLAEVIDMFEWANERQFGGEGSDYAPRFEALDLPLLVIAGAHDDLAPPASVRPGFTSSRSRDKTYRAVQAGHIDLLVGRDAAKTTWPIVGDWLRDRVARTKVG